MIDYLSIIYGNNDINIIDINDTEIDNEFDIMIYMNVDRVHYFKHRINKKDYNKFLRKQKLKDLFTNGFK
jgi:hypothetical protein